MRIFSTFGAVVLSGVLLTGCLDSDSDDDNDLGGQPTPEQPAQPSEPVQTVSFTALVRDIFNNTSATAEPVPINELNITFDDQENEGAFDDLLTQQ